MSDDSPIVWLYDVNPTNHEDHGPLEVCRDGVTRVLIINDPKQLELLEAIHTEIKALRVMFSAASELDVSPDEVSDEN